MHAGHIGTIDGDTAATIILSSAARATTYRVTPRDQCHVPTCTLAYQLRPTRWAGRGSIW
eukprot:1150103-Rhodomonas_salina.2